MTLSLSIIHTPIGALGLLASENGLRHILPGRDEGDVRMQRDELFPQADIQERDTPLLAYAGQQIREYLAGGRKVFDLPLEEEGTAFQRRIWRALREIPYGETIAYTALAARVESPAAVRAVGNACGANPLLLVTPCHRVLHKTGGLGGFSSGLRVKAWLLEMERRAALCAA